MDAKELERLLADLGKITKDDLPRFTLNGIKAHAKVVSVYDGDTCDVVFYHDEMKAAVRFKCRLLGYDAPELDDEPHGELARDYLAHLCMGKIRSKFNDKGVWDKKNLQKMLDENENTVYAMFGKQGKYGRPLVTLKTSPRGTCINELVSAFVVDHQ
jgi:endonuclease YncB( thermonuclease family)